jgi:S-DNA-T family DNA segregation ATPase FtsK/SpoIIIE
MYTVTVRFNPFRRKARRRHSAASDGWLTPHARRAIAGIIMLVFSLITVLGFFGAAGPTGGAILTGLTWLFGWLAYAVPFALIAWGLHLVWPQRVGLERLRVIGLTLTAIGFLGLFHLIGFSADDALQAAADGKGGGYLGFMLGFPLSQAVSRVAATLIFAGVWMVGLILTFRVSPLDVWEYLQQAFSSSDEDAAEEDEDTGDETDGETDEEPGPRFNVSMMPTASRREEHVPAARRQGAPREVVQRMQTLSRRYRPNVLGVLQSAGRAGVRDKEVEKRNKQIIQQTLENFGIRVEMDETNVGPTVTQYTLRPDQGTKLARIRALQDDLALALAAHPIRIEAPIPNKNLVGIEIPNKAPTLVRLRDLLTSREFKEAESPLSFPLGKDVSGKVIVDTLERLPHLLIAGATGAGKSVNIHTLLVSLIYRNSPEVVKFIMVDPKRVELPAYNDIPHLLSPVIVDTEKTMAALKWALTQMDVRYRLLEEAGARNLMSFNLSNPQEAKPYIIIVIDELADLMVKHGREVEGPIVRLSQMARAVGIHLVLATQRPSVNVLTGLIKANVPARIAFSVASQVDSRTVIDMAGAEKLVGNGDMLYLAGDKARPLRVQGGFVSEDEVRQVVAAVRATGKPQYEESVTSVAASGSSAAGEMGDDPLFDEARRVVVQSRKASASLLQRRLRVGYARAARLLDMLEEQGVIGEAEGNKPRPILIETETGDDGFAEEDAFGEPEEETEDESTGTQQDSFADDRQW